jgi:cytochrome P450
VAGYAGLMQAACNDALDTALPPGTRQATVDMEALWSRLAIGAILRTLFSLEDAAQAREAMQATRVLSEVAMREMFWPMTLPDWLPLPGKAAKRQALRTLRAVVGGQIAQRHADQAAGRAIPADDLLAHLLALRDEATGQGLSEAEVFDQCIVSFQAGHETTATALTWWSTLMAANPGATARAVAEVDTALAGALPGPDDLARLPWLVATLKEAMRLYPPTTAIFSRRCTQALQLGGHAVPKGALLRITIWSLHHDARWFDQPEVFRPERFLPDAPPPPRGAYLPFGAGPRVCIGQHFALLEMVVAAAMFLQRLQLPDQAGCALPAPEVHATLRPRGGLHLVLHRRMPPSQRPAQTGT